MPGLLFAWAASVHSCGGMLSPKGTSSSIASGSCTCPSTSPASALSSLTNGMLSSPWQRMSSCATGVNGPSSSSPASPPASSSSCRNLWNTRVSSGSWGPARATQRWTVAGASVGYDQPRNGLRDGWGCGLKGTRHTCTHLAAGFQHPCPGGPAMSWVWSCVPRRCRHGAEAAPGRKEAQAGNITACASMLR